MSEQTEQLGSGPADVEFSKGHGTQNDFVVLPDPDARLRLAPDVVAVLCDRRQGIGGDGVLRVARAGSLVAGGELGALPDGVTAGDWFMDYRNADGSIAEMCGNGVRVFAHYLLATGLQREPEFVVGTRAGARAVVVHSFDEVYGEVTVDMGPVRILGESTATVAGSALPGIGVDVGNPHLACVDPALTADGLAALDLSVPPGFDPELFPHGVNVEILTALGADGAVDMRVYERGVGETRSCGTGTVAAAAAALTRAGFVPAEETAQVRVRVPGGAVTVGIEQGRAWLRGPSVLVGSGHLAGAWWAGA
ncbi:diaminopimelate epimerase [Nocardia spumae]|uniref:diaminopimelate epimerase n=1 Tax=Nocardia spumae TaxID=2887190 RepID=UPI001D132880|nr:diaminopimelate epimerase [Nocardia spumae]